MYIYTDIYIYIYLYVYTSICIYIYINHIHICKNSYKEKSHKLDIVDDVNSLNIRNEFLLVRFDLMNILPCIDKIFSSKAPEEVLEK